MRQNGSKAGSDCMAFKGRDLLPDEKGAKSRAALPRPPFATSRDLRRPPAKLLLAHGLVISVRAEGRVNFPGAVPTPQETLPREQNTKTLNLGLTNTATDGPIGGQCPRPEHIGPLSAPEPFQGSQCQVDRVPAPEKLPEHRTPPASARPRTKSRRK